MNSYQNRPARPVIAIQSFRAGVFDLDGVVTRTARIHEAAWKQLFDEVLLRAAPAQNPFDHEDYRRYVDGKPRLDGIRSFLASRNIVLPEGGPDDPPERETVHGLAKRKNHAFRERLRRDSVEVFDSTIDFIRRLRAAGLKTALVSSSKNAAAVLQSAGLEALFDARVDGVEAERLGLPGKPCPDIFLEACTALGVQPAQAIAVEDALSGVQAARAAGCGRIIGIARSGQAEELCRYGADIVVRDLDELDLNTHEALPDALEHFDAIAQMLAGQRPAVFLDYDGTLTPIVDRPDRALLSDAMRAAVRDLAARCPVAIVSGRDRADVERLVGIEELIYAGSHGFDIAGPDGLQLQHEEAVEFMPALDRAETLLRERLAGIDGALIERKRYAIAAHYRLVAPDQTPAIEAAVDAALAQEERQLRKTGGKMIFELRPRLPWHKGRAVCWLLEVLKLDRPDVLPIYIGDDETDEDAFTALNERGGLGLLVAAGPQASAAHYRLRDPDAVGTFLRRLLETTSP